MASPLWPPASTGSSVIERGRVFAFCVRDGMILGTLTGAVAGTVAAPVIGTILGAVFGAVLAVPICLLAGAIIAQSVPSTGLPAGAAGRFRRRVDLTFAALAVSTALLAVGWISLRPLVGPWPAVSMVVTVVAGLVVSRIGLLRPLGASRR